MSFSPAAGKFGRVNVSGVPIEGSFRWGAQFRRERLDVTNFESTLSASGYNLFTDGLTGPLDSTFSIEGYYNLASANLLFPEGQLTFSFLYTKTPAFGFSGVSCDILEFSPGVVVRDRQQYTAQLQSNGAVPYAA